MTVLAKTIVLQKSSAARAAEKKGDRAALPDAMPAVPFRFGAGARAIRIVLQPGTCLDPALLAAGDLRPATPFQTPHWLRNWQEQVGVARGVLPVTASGFIGTVPVFSLPLAVTRRFGCGVLSWHGSQLSDYGAPLIGAAFRALAPGIDGARVMREIAEALGCIDLVLLNKSPRLVEGVANPFVFGAALPYHAQGHAISVPVDADFETFYAARRSGKTRRRIREKLGALERAGAVTFRFAESVEEARGVTLLCLAAKRRQLKASGHWDPFSDSRVHDYVVSSFADNIGHGTWACSLRCGDTILASAVGFRSAWSWMIYQMSMEESGKERHSPGTHLLMHLLRECIAAGATELDLGLGDESYKAEWCDVDKDLAVSTLALTAKGRVIEQVVRTRARLLSRLSSDPVLHARAKRLQSLACRLGIPF